MVDQHPQRDSNAREVQREAVFPRALELFRDRSRVLAQADLLTSQHSAETGCCDTGPVCVSMRRMHARSPRIVVAAIATAALLGGCGGADGTAKKSPASSAAPSPPSDAYACLIIRGAEPKGELPTADALTKSADEVAAIARKYPKDTTENAAFTRLAEAYRQQATAGTGQELLDARAAVRSALATTSGVCGDDPALSGTAKTSAPDPLAGKFPKGYPKKVRVADIPSPINSAYEGMKFAVQLAPGVYTALPPGARVRDAALGDTADGYCASIKAYSRRFRGGQEFGGSCW